MNTRSATTFRTKPISLADIAAQSGGIHALHQRVYELRAMGLNFAAKAIENEMTELDL
ncbi:hypothetical protein OG874_42835 [Nocardia sp. NBC_00565]|uniref:hypothetical protein n=1 Tax=Nocardia sp. NBC_00565 TaxID=2975993 RepID=UPI002E80B112|nr:hypothetical protein [Nocardia sp. NBC_00565]WUC03325.1 hypothetical protein OG874_42835 [Nocardia sp. NBC_00565]